MAAATGQQAWAELRRGVNGKGQTVFVLQGETSQGEKYQHVFSTKAEAVRWHRASPRKHVGLLEDLS